MEEQSSPSATSTVSSNDASTVDANHGQKKHTWSACAYLILMTFCGFYIAGCVILFPQQRLQALISSIVLAILYTLETMWIAFLVWEYCKIIVAAKKWICSDGRRVANEAIGPDAPTLRSEHNSDSDERSQVVDESGQEQHHQRIDSAQSVDPGGVVFLILYPPGVFLVIKYILLGNTNPPLFPIRFETFGLFMMCAFFVTALVLSLLFFALTLVMGLLLLCLALAARLFGIIRTYGLKLVRYDAQSTD